MGIGGFLTVFVNHHPGKPAISPGKQFEAVMVFTPQGAHIHRDP